MHAVLALNRSRARGALDAKELAFVGALRPHLLAAYSLYSRMAGLSATNATLRAAFDRAPIAMLALDAAGRVLECNAAATALLDDPAAGVAHGPARSLSFSRAATHADYVGALRALAAGATTRSLAIRRRSGGAARDVLMHLCHAPTGLGLVRQRLIALLVDTDRSGDPAYCRQALEALLGLTPQEANVAFALRTCGEPEAVALRLGLRISTVRSHLKHAFDKAGVWKQAEFVRLVDRITGGAPTPAADD